jgi:hypothetical protein
MGEIVAHETLPSEGWKEPKLLALIAQQILIS